MGGVLSLSPRGHAVHRAHCSAPRRCHTLHATYRPRPLLLHVWLQSAIVTDVTRGEKPTVYTHDGKRHGFDDGDHVVFREVRA